MAGRDVLRPRPRSLPAIVSAIVRRVSALIPLWPRLHTLSAMWPPCVRRVSALCPSNFVRHDGPPSVRRVSALATPPNLVRSVWHMCVHVSALGPPCARPSLSAHGLLWGRGGFISHHCATHSVYIACALVSCVHMFILPHQIRPSQAHPALEKLFCGLRWFNFFVCFLLGRGFLLCVVPCVRPVSALSPRWPPYVGHVPALCARVSTLNSKPCPPLSFLR